MSSITARSTLALIGLALTTTITNPLRAQVPATASIDIIASIINPINAGVTHPLDFGRMLSGTNKTVAPNSSAAGRVEISGQSGSAISVTLTMPTLLNASGGSTIAVSGWNYMASSAATLAGATAVSFNGGTPVAIAATLTGGSPVVRVYVALGATANVAGAAVGSYTGSGQISALYTDL